MSEEKKDEKKEAAATPQKYEKPKGAEAEKEIVINGEKRKYKINSDWIVLRKNEKPVAEIFYTRYALQGEEKKRPITFVFNGGPGASSAFLHLGAAGPYRIQLLPDGKPLAPPYELVENESTWLQFTDLVFIDPTATGLSRMIRDDKKDEKELEAEKATFWKLKKDLDSICEFIKLYLSEYKSWGAPICVAGESYGGYRTAKLATVLQQEYGVGLAGSIIISPALDLNGLHFHDYNTLPWIEIFPTMALAAAYHGKSQEKKEDETLTEFRQRVCEFAMNSLLPVLAGGDLIDAEYRANVYDQVASYLGLEPKIVRMKEGRIAMDYFSKNLLRDEGKLIGLYDASQVISDPFFDREDYWGPEPSLHAMDPAFVSGINNLLTEVVGLKTDRIYTMLSEEANTTWKDDLSDHILHKDLHSVDDLRFGICMNEGMGVFLTHGLFDQVTPSFSADRLLGLMKLTKEQKQRVTTRYYMGGHMFYSWEESRKQFAADLAEFYKKYCSN